MAEWDLGPSRWEVESSAAQVDEDTGLWIIDLQEMPASFWTVVNSTDGRDVRVTSSDADTQVPAFLLNFDHTAETGFVIAKDAISPSASDSVYIYAGNAGATMPPTGSTYGRDATLADYSSFWAPGLTDLTGETGNDLSEEGDPTSGATGPVNGLTAYTYDGTGDYLKTAVNSAVGFDTDGITIIVWARKAVGAGAGHLFHTGTDFTIGGRRVRLEDMDFSGDVRLRYQIMFSGGEAASRMNSSGEFPANNTWFQAVVSHDASSDANQPDTYIDGSGPVNSGSLGASGTRSTGADSVVVGNRNDGSSAEDWEGDIALVAWLPSAVSANWVSTWHRMWNSPGTVFTVGVEENEPAGTGETNWIELSLTAEEKTNAAQPSWLNPDNAKSNLIDAATCDIPGGGFDEPTAMSPRLKVYNPNGALNELIGKTPLGIIWEIAGTGEDDGSFSETKWIVDVGTQLIIGGSLVGTAKVGAQWTDDEGLLTQTYGGEADMWGTTDVTGNDIAANDFGLSMQFENGAATEPALMSVYRVRVKVFYEDAAAANTGFFNLMGQF